MEDSNLHVDATQKTGISASISAKALKFPTEKNVKCAVLKFGYFQYLTRYLFIQHVFYKQCVFAIVRVIKLGRMR
jgi:hypothetical protein